MLNDTEQLLIITKRLKDTADFADRSTAAVEYQATRTEGALDTIDDTDAILDYIKSAKEKLGAALVSLEHAQRSIECSTHTMKGLHNV